VVLVHVDTEVVLATGISASLGMLAVLAYTTMPGRDVPSALSVLLEPCVVVVEWPWGYVSGQCV
jgi:hypothetical protein